MPKGTTERRDGLALAMTACAALAALTCPSGLAQQSQAAQDQGTPSSQAAPARSDTADPLSDLLLSPKTADQTDGGAQPAPASTPAGGSPTPPPSSQQQAPIPVPQLPTADGAAETTAVAQTSSAHSRQIEEIVVTATKREESLRDIPASISAFTGAGLENAGKLSLNEYIKDAPGVVVSQTSSGLSKVSIRGVSTDANALGTIPSTVGVFVGDTAFTDPYVQNVTPDMSAFDLAGVQILKGPQGTLFGGSALAGAVRYELQKPVLGEWQLRGFAQEVHPQDGSFAFTAGVALNLPLIKEDNVAFRFDYIRRQYPGVYEDTFSSPPQKHVDKGDGSQIRAILLWVPDDRWKFTLTHLSQDYNSPDSLNGFADSPKGPRSSNQFVIPGPLRTNFSLDTLEVNYNILDTMRLVSLTSHTQKRFLGTVDYTSKLLGATPPSGYPTSLATFVTTDLPSNALSQELRLQSTGNGPFQWIVGGYFFRYWLNAFLDANVVDEQKLADFIAQSPLPGSLTQYLSQTSWLIYFVTTPKSDEKAAFFDLSYKLWDRLELSAGSRFYWTSIAGHEFSTGLLILPENNGQVIDVTNRLSARGLSPKVSATYHFDENLSVYASASKGFRFGGLQITPATPSNGVPPTYKSDFLWNYEIGLRTSWLDDTLHADVTPFYIRYKNPILQQETSGGVVGLNYNNNVSAAVSRGFEANVLWHPPIDGITLSLAGGLTDAHITKPFTAAGNVPVMPGTQMPGAARNQVSTSIQYFHPLGAIDVGTDFGYTYIGKGFVDITHSFPINNYGTFGAGLNLSSQAVGFHPRLSINVSNIFNVTRAVGGLVTHTGGGSGATIYNYSLNAPRTVSLRLGFDL